METYAKWAVALLIVCLVATPTGAAILVGTLAGSVYAGFGAGLIALGGVSAVTSRWIGED